MLEEVREPFRLVGAESDDRTWLPPGFLECVAHVPHHRLGRPFPHTLERSPPLPGSFQARSGVLRGGDQLWITHGGIPPPLKVSVSGKPRPVVRSASRTGPSAASAAIDERLEPGAAYAPAPAAPVSRARPLEPTPQSAERAPP